jgi:hypothetical protein
MQDIYEVKDMLYYEICIKRILAQEDTGYIIETNKDFDGCISKEKYIKILEIIKGEK